MAFSHHVSLVPNRTREGGERERDRRKKKVEKIVREYTVIEKGK